MTSLDSGFYIKLIIKQLKTDNFLGWMVTGQKDRDVMFCLICEKWSTGHIYTILANDAFSLDSLF